MDTLKSIPKALADTPDFAPARGLSEAEAAALLAVSGPPPKPVTSRSYRSIVRANVLTVFNMILAAFGALTLAFGDWRDALFLGVIVANTTIGIAQETRAKRALDRLALLVAPRALAVRDGRPREVAVAEVVPGDLLRVGPGDQVLADGELVEAHELRLDESILTGESEPVERGRGERVHSGAFVADGAGAYLVDAVGEHSFAARIVGEARTFRHPRSPLEQAVNRLLYGLVVLMVGLGAVLGYSLYHRHVHIHEAVSTSVAGAVSLVPEGLIVLLSLTYAVACIRMARHGVLAQQLNAIESLASVEVICVDKTGTLTESALRVAGVEPAEGLSERDFTAILARFAAGASVRNGTLLALAEAFPADPEPADEEIPFSSGRRFSALRFDDDTYVLGAPERLPLGVMAERARTLQSEGRRVLAVATGHGAPADRDFPPRDLRPLGLVVLAERLRPNVQATVAFLLEQGVEVKVLSGDAPSTVAAIARDVGITVRRACDGSEIPEDVDELREFALAANVIGRISPDGKRAIVAALHDAGRYVAMLGDGVNDVPALKRSRLAIAQGSGAQMARSVADLVLVDGDFDAIPALIHEGRQALRNLQRVTKMYVTKSAFAAFLILTIGTSSEAYPLLPRHLSIAAALAIGIPTFFLALAPSSGSWRVEGFVRRVARFAVPAGTIVGVGTVTGYLFALHDLDYSVIQARTIATTVVVVVGLYLVLVLESTGSVRRSGIVGAMCLALAGAFAVILLLPATRHFFQFAAPGAGMLATGLLAAAVSIGALVLAGFGLSASTRSDELTG
ncbi:MAG TPA: HAD-IC family P-type ATPase [Solirubrobacteraceae bacterium]|nr:HAD-IC family P-type ATPase [Solirubrobacteraceae bacterium]